MPDISLQLNALRGQLEARARIVQNVLHLTSTIYKPGTTVKYFDRSVEPVTSAIGKVQTVERLGNEVYVVVAPLRGRKAREVKVEDILGTMLESE